MEQIPNQDSSLQIEETTQTPQDEHNQQEAQAAPKSNEFEVNLRQLRQEKERIARENEELKRKIAQAQTQTQPAQPKRDPRDLVEWGEVEQEFARRDKAKQQERLHSQFPDISQVLSPENEEKLRQEDPELYATIMSSNDDYAKLSTAYKAIKKLGIYADKSYDKEKEAIASNNLKPRSSAAAAKSSSPLAGLNDYLDNPDEYRKALWKDMLASSRSKRD